MKVLKKITLFAAISTSLLFVQCKDEDDNVLGEIPTCTDGIMNGDETDIDCGGTSCEACEQQTLSFSGSYKQVDQMGRPSINFIFGTDGYRDAFNVTVPSEMQAEFQDRFQDKLLILNPGYTTNTLGLDATAFTTLISNDVLWLAKTGATTYSNGTEIMTGRALSDDVVDATLLWIYGGPDGTQNPELTSDVVPANDAPFSNSFPYLAEPF